MLALAVQRMWWWCSRAILFPAGLLVFSGMCRGASECVSLHAGTASALQLALRSSLLQNADFDCVFYAAKRFSAFNVFSGWQHWDWLLAALGLASMGLLCLHTHVQTRWPPPALIIGACVHAWCACVALLRALLLQL